MAAGSRPAGSPAGIRPGRRPVGAAGERTGLVREARTECVARGLSGADRQCAARGSSGAGKRRRRVTKAECCADRRCTVLSTDNRSTATFTALHTTTQAVSFRLTESDSHAAAGDAHLIDRVVDAHTQRRQGDGDNVQVTAVLHTRDTVR